MTLETLEAKINTPLTLFVDPRVPDVGRTEGGEWYALTEGSASPIGIVEALQRLKAAFPIAAPLFDKIDLSAYQ